MVQPHRIWLVFVGCVKRTNSSQGWTLVRFTHPTSAHLFAAVGSSYKNACQDRHLTDGFQAPAIRQNPYTRICRDA